MSAAVPVGDVLAGDEEVIQTTYGPITATIFGDRSRSPCIAYHEVGLNHRTCFHSLIVASGPNSLLLKNFFIIFIDAPGCQASDSDIPSEAQPITLEKLAKQVFEVAEHYKLREVLGLGVGNGGYILTHCAAQHPKLFAGLILISPSCRQASWYEWSAGRIAMTQLYYSGWTQWARESIARRLFSTTTLQILGGDSDLLKAFHREAPSISPRGAYYYLSAALSRPSLVPFLSKVKCRVLLVYGEEGLYQKDSLELSSFIDKSKFALVEVPSAGVLVNEERPTEMLSPMQLFLTALQLEGYGLGPSFQVGY